MDKLKNEPVSNEYLYSVRNDQFTVYEGSLYETIDDQGYCFICKNLKKQFGCSIKEGEVRNAVVWFTDRQDDKARHVLFCYEASLIQELQNKIKNHQAKIDLLSGSIISK